MPKAVKAASIRRPGSRALAVAAKPATATRKATAAPTGEAMSELQVAYDHFNTALFAGQLPPCLITLQRKGAKVMGYFSPSRFERTDGAVRTDEIAMNPIHFKHKGIREVMQTLVHEMVHLWQAHFGTPSRAAYHNHEWAAQMQAVGLMPSDTGKAGGKIVGQTMGDYPIEGGAFLKAHAALLATGFKVTWYDRQADAVYGTAAAGGDDEDGEGEEGDSAETPSGKRVKFSCPACAVNAWGKGSLNLICGDCDKPMQAAV